MRVESAGERDHADSQRGRFGRARREHAQPEAVVDRIGQAEPRLDAIEIRIRLFGPGGDRVPRDRARHVQRDLDRAAAARHHDAHRRGRFAVEAVEAVEDVRIVEAVAGFTWFGRADRAVRALLATAGRRQLEERVSSLAVRQREVEMVAGVVGQRRVAAIGRRQRDVERMRVGEPVSGFEPEIERVARAQRVVRVERHRQRGAVGRRLRVERQIAREAVHRQVADHAGGVAPAADLAVDAVAAEERKQQRIAAAHAGEVAPVGGFRPEDHRFAIDVPGQQAAAELRGDPDERRAGVKFVNVVLLEDRHGESGWAGDGSNGRSIIGPRPVGENPSREIASF
ncbi:hypothetical protein BCEN4_520126 [Burkholderia cenocepacia]|nr:hypothetical protein BCEN4_520126 [Burkholderia cenocepacia]